MLRLLDQPFAKFGISKADFRLRTCRATRGPADVRHAQLTALPILKFDKSGYWLFYPVFDLKN